MGLISTFHLFYKDRGVVGVAEGLRLAYSLDLRLPHPLAQGVAEVWQVWQFHRSPPVSFQKVLRLPSTCLLSFSYPNACKTFPISIWMLFFEVAGA